MKKIIFILLASVVSSYLQGQSSNQNYISTIVAREELTGDLSATNKDDVSQTTSYFDGLGRPIQNVVSWGANGTTDLITETTYDELGRPQRNYLPLPSSGVQASYKTNFIGDQQTYYNTLYPSTNDGDYAFVENGYEPSTLARVVKTSAPGNTWRMSGDHTIDITYRSNNDTDDLPVRWFFVESGNFVTQTLIDYAESSLWVVETRDENSGDQEGVTIEYTNKLGQVVLKRVKASTNEYYDTYYIYDSFGDLRYVVPPMASASIGNTVSLLNSEEFKKKWMFCYEYDERRRLISKRVPGSDWMHMIYDNRNRLVLTQDGNQRHETISGTDESIPNYSGKSYKIEGGGSLTLTAGFQYTAAGTSIFEANTISDVSDRWIFTKYDHLNRPVLTGFYHSEMTISELRTHVSQQTDFVETFTSSGELEGYDNSSFPIVDMDDLLSVTYYDNYNFVTNLSSITPTSGSYIVNPKGQITGAKMRVLGNNKLLSSVSFYDNRYRNIKTVTENHLNGEDVVVTNYKNKVSSLVTNLEMTHTSDSYSGTLDVIQTFDYDHLDRPTEVTHQIDNGTVVVLSKTEYDDLGRAITKKLGSDNGGSSFVQLIDYNYNIRNWLTEINDPLAMGKDDKFGMKLEYDDASQYNGNIGKIIWKTDGLNEQDYTYTYDNLSRLKTAFYNSYSSTNHFSIGGDDNGIRYDANGNIKNLTRHFNGTMVDNLSYFYETNASLTGNQLMEVVDNGTSLLFEDQNPANNAPDYSYDSNGNMISDYNKGIESITYNHLNLPIRVDFDDNTWVEYTYDAAGIKLKKLTDAGSSTDYVGGIHYIDGALSFMQHGEGRALKSGSSFTYEYNLTDHLGNVRVSVDNVGTVIQRDDYYPFGLTFNSYSTSPENKYKYNGKEEQEETQWYDYGARYFDPAIVRFISIDPASDNYMSWTPYHYVMNNPIIFVDPTGMFTELYNENGKKIGEDEKGADGSIAIVKDENEADRVKANTKNGTHTESSTLKSTVKLPSAHVRGEMGKAVERAGKNSFHEEGGYFGALPDGTERVVHAKPGEESDPRVDPEASIDVWDAADPSQVDGNMTIEGTFHTHPSGKIVERPGSNTIGGETKTSGFDNQPSNINGRGDIPNAKDNASYVKGNSYVLSQGNGKVYIYNGSGTVATFPLKKFMSIGIKEKK